MNSVVEKGVNPATPHVQCVRALAKGSAVHARVHTISTRGHASQTALSVSSVVKATARSVTTLVRPAQVSCKSFYTGKISNCIMEGSWFISRRVVWLEISLVSVIPCLTPIQSCISLTYHQVPGRAAAWPVVTAMCLEMALVSLPLASSRRP